jgi:hypothetical protein
MVQWGPKRFCLLVKYTMYKGVGLCNIEKMIPLTRWAEIIKIMTTLV